MNARERNREPPKHLYLNKRQAFEHECRSQRQGVFGGDHDEIFSFFNESTQNWDDWNGRETLWRRGLAFVGGEGEVFGVVDDGERINELKY